MFALTIGVDEFKELLEPIENILVDNPTWSDVVRLTVSDCSTVNTEWVVLLDILEKQSNCGIIAGAKQAKFSKFLCSDTVAVQFSLKNLLRPLRKHGRVGLLCTLGYSTVLELTFHGNKTSTTKTIKCSDISKYLIGTCYIYETFDGTATQADAFKDRFEGHSLKYKHCEITGTVEILFNLLSHPPTSDIKNVFSVEKIISMAGASDEGYMFLSIEDGKPFVIERRIGEYCSIQSFVAPENSSIEDHFKLHVYVRNPLAHTLYLLIANFDDTVEEIKTKLLGLSKIVSRCSELPDLQHKGLILENSLKCWELGIFNGSIIDEIPVLDHLPLLPEDLKYPVYIFDQVGVRRLRINTCSTAVVFEVVKIIVDSNIFGTSDRKLYGLFSEGVMLNSTAAMCSVAGTSSVLVFAPQGGLRDSVMLRISADQTEDIFLRVSLLTQFHDVQMFVAQQMDIEPHDVILKTTGSVLLDLLPSDTINDVYWNQKRTQEKTLSIYATLRTVRSSRRLFFQETMNNNEIADSAESDYKVEEPSDLLEVLSNGDSSTDLNTSTAKFNCELSGGNIEELSDVFENLSYVE